MDGKIKGRGTRGRGAARLHKVCGGTSISACVPSRYDFARLSSHCDVPSTPDYA